MFNRLKIVNIHMTIDRHTLPILRVSAKQIVETTADPRGS